MVASLPVFECFSTELLHHITILPRVGARAFRDSVLWAGALEHLMIVAWLLTAKAPFLLTLVPVPSISISNEICDTSCYLFFPCPVGFWFPPSGALLTP